MSGWAMAVGRVLVDSSLRSLILGITVGSVLLVLRIRSGSVRHGTLVAVLAAMLLMPVLLQCVPTVTIPLQIPSGSVGKLVAGVPDVAALSNFALPAALPEANPLTGIQTLTSAPPLPTPSWPAIALALYGFGVVLLLIRIILGWRVMCSLGISVHPLEMNAARMVYESKSVVTPVTIGIIRPRILLPETWTTWSKEKLLAILAHETAHIRRHDPLISFCARLNCALFWFHPLAWWLQKQLAITAEQSCDDVAVETIGAPRAYAEILLDAAQTIRRHGGRFSWQATGVDGNGSLGQRIDRILRHNRRPISTTRKIAIAFSCAAIIFLIVACRDESSPLSIKGSIQAEEQRAVERLASDRARLLDLQKMQAARTKLFQAVQSMTAADADNLESQLKKNPEDLEAREKLVTFYSRDLQKQQPEILAKVIPARRRHILWLIENHPDSDLLTGAVTRLNPGSSKQFADAQGYEEAKRLWLSIADRSGATPTVLGNAALFFEVSDKLTAERLLLRAKILDNSEQWSIRLGRLYGLALLGVTEVIPLGGVSNRPPANILISSMDLNEARSYFAQQVREVMIQTKDPQLLNSAAQYLILYPLGSELGRTYLDRALQLDPTLISAHQALLRTRTPRYPETRLAIRSVEREKKYAAVSALPEPERFVMLKEMAEYSYSEAGSLEVLDPDGAKAGRARSRKYAEDLLKLAPKFRKDPDYSAAVFSADILVAHIAARDGDNATAVKYLRDASRVPSSEELAYSTPRVPWTQLCRLLIGSGYGEDTVAFLEHFANINVSDRDQILRWAADARGGLKK